MQISLSVPYDEAMMRRTVKVILRPHLRLLNILWVSVIILGLALVASDASSTLGYAVAAVGLMPVVIRPRIVNQAVRQQSRVLKDGAHITLDDEWAMVRYPLAELRFRWAGFDRVVETPEVWYLMFGQAGAFDVPKDRMTEEQRAEFAAFLGRLPIAAAGARVS